MRDTLPLLLPPHAEEYVNHMKNNDPSRWRHKELKRHSINKVLEQVTMNGARDADGVKYTSEHAEILVKAEKIYEESRKADIWKTEYDFDGKCARFHCSDPKSDLPSSRPSFS
jgi:hypothetical protein